MSIDANMKCDAGSAPVHIKNAFDPSVLLGCDPVGWIGVLKGLAPQLPVQLHCEPQDIDDREGTPIFTNVVDTLKTLPALGPLLESARNQRARLKFRMSGRGKFIHHNRYPRRQAICCLHGHMDWLFVQSTEESDVVLGSTENDNWNGFRSELYPSMLSLQEMEDLAAKMPENTKTVVLRLSAGDVLEFDGRWWHSTSYDKPVLNVFFTPGKDMEVAVKEQKRRMAMPMQSMLKVASISMAKCSRLSADWRTSADGTKVDWAADGQKPPAATETDEQLLCTK